jgi:hypothetical protein
MMIRIAPPWAFALGVLFVVLATVLLTAWDRRRDRAYRDYMERRVRARPAPPAESPHAFDAREMYQTAGEPWTSGAAATNLFEDVERVRRNMTESNVARALREEMHDLYSRRDLGLPLSDAEAMRLAELRQWFGR